MAQSHRRLELIEIYLTIGVRISDGHQLIDHVMLDLVAKHFMDCTAHAALTGGAVIMWSGNPRTSVAGAWCKAPAA